MPVLLSCPLLCLMEIDTGVSGEIADRMADIMQEMAGRPSGYQYNSFATDCCSAHYKIALQQDNETETNSHIRCLTDREK